MDLGFWILNEVAWIKTNAMPNFRGVRFTQAHETLIWAQKRRGNRYTFNHQAMKALNDDLQMRSDWNLPLCTGKERIKVDGSKAHSTQKPEALLYRVILSSSNLGDVVLDPFFGSGTTGAVAKKLHRRWLGIERDSGYVEIARQRLDAIQPPPYAEDVFAQRSKRTRPRVPFGALVECGMIQPGETLYFGKTGELAAVVLANGSLAYDGRLGSIHQIAREIRQAPCNGWDQWYVVEPVTGDRVVIDALRERYIAEAQAMNPAEQC
jgi:modification methylase